MPNAAFSMAIVWAWFLYFMPFDWRFAGTPGKLIVGLRLRNAGTGVSGFVKYLLRSLATIIVPVAIAGRMTAVFTASRVIGVLECLENPKRAVTDRIYAGCPTKGCSSASPSRK